MIPLYAMLALAGPELDVHASLAAGPVGEERGGYGLGGAIGFAPHRRVHLALDAEAVFGAGGAQAAAFPSIRWLAGDPAGVALGPTVGAGVFYADGAVEPLLVGGVGLDVPLAGSLGGRLQGRYLVPFGSAGASLDVSVGVVWPRRRPEAELVVEPLPEPVPEPAPGSVPAPSAALPPVTVAVNAPDALVWLPHPVCAWLSPADASALMSTLPLEARPSELSVKAPGFLPTKIDPASSAPVELLPAPLQGSVAVTARPGDIVEVGGRSLPVDADGFVVVNAPEGPVTIVVRGAGRREEFEVAVANGFGAWIRASEPKPVRANFASGSSALTPATQKLVDALVADAGGYSFKLEGSYSPEGDPEQNLALAAARANALRDALIAAGADPARIVVEPPRPPQPDLDAAQQRSVFITAVIQ